MGAGVAAGTAVGVELAGELGKLVMVGDGDTMAAELVATGASVPIGELGTAGEVGKLVAGGF